MKKASKSHPRSTLREMSFEQLLAAVHELADARREYDGKSPKERRAAAEWAYDAGMAHDLFSRSVLAVGGSASVNAGFDSGVMALAIDPLLGIPFTLALRHTNMFSLGRYTMGEDDSVSSSSSSSSSSSDSDGGRIEDNDDPRQRFSPQDQVREEHVEYGIEDEDEDDDENDPRPRGSRPPNSIETTR